MTAREKWIAYVTIVLKEITRFMRIWQQTLIPPAISTLLYFVIFGNLIGKRIGQMDGFDYMDFLVPGLILMAVINASYQNVVGSFFGAKWGKSIEELLVSPTPNSIILLAYITAVRMPRLKTLRSVNSREIPVTISPTSIPRATPPVM